MHTGRNRVWKGRVQSMREEVVKLEKVKRNCGKAMVVARIARIFGLVLAILTLVLGVGLVAFRKPLDQALADAEAKGDWDRAEWRAGIEIGIFDVFTTSLTSEGGAVMLAKVMFVSGVWMAVLTVTLYYVEKMFGEIQNGDSPFRESVLKRMKVIFALATVMALDNSLLIGFVVGFSLWCVYQIFEYGGELQRFSDETL